MRRKALPTPGPLTQSRIVAGTSAGGGPVREICIDLVREEDIERAESLPRPYPTLGKPNRTAGQADSRRDDRAGTGPSARPLPPFHSQILLGQCFEKLRRNCLTSALEGQTIALKGKQKSLKNLTGALGEGP